jgi:hypothetical protein
MDWQCIELAVWSAPFSISNYIHITVLGAGPSCGARRCNVTAAEREFWSSPPVRVRRQRMPGQQAVMKPPFAAGGPEACWVVVGCRTTLGRGGLAKTPAPPRPCLVTPPPPSKETFRSGGRWRSHEQREISYYLAASAFRWPFIYLSFCFDVCPLARCSLGPDGLNLLFGRYFSEVPRDPYRRERRRDRQDVPTSSNG